MKPLSVVYFGAPSFSADFLESLLNQHSDLLDITAVVTQPDRPVGRKQFLTPTPVKMTAHKHRLEVISSMQESSLPHLLRSADCALVFAYGEIIPSSLLSLPRYGFINIHPSLLPLYRGASPTAYPLILGDIVTGVSIMQMDKKMDHGPILAQKKLTISSDITRNQLETYIHQPALDLLIDILSHLPLVPTDQNHTSATYTRLLTKEDGYIELTHLKKALNNIPFLVEELPKPLSIYHNSYATIAPEKRTSGQIVYDLYRGLSPWPGLWTTVSIQNQEKRLKLTRLSYSPAGLIIEKVQLEGKNEVDFSTFQTAYRIF